MISTFKSSHINPVITVKVPQMYQIANYGLCVTHSFIQNITFDFVFAWHMVKDKNWKSFEQKESTEHLKPHGTRISNLIKLEVSNWKHPLLLPVILLEDHVYNADICKGFDLSPRTTALERRLRATKTVSARVSPLNLYRSGWICR